MRNYEARAKDFIAQIYPYIENCKTTDSIYNVINKFNIEHHRKVKVARGSTRVVLITSDYVIKFDYDGWGKNTFGSCRSESRMYKQAVKEGYAYLLAKITPYRQHYNRTFYIMPKITGIGREWDDAENFVEDEEAYKWLCDNIGDRHFMNYGWKDGHIVMIDYAYNSTLRHFE